MNNKSTCHPSIHHLRSIRLKGYDYAQQGLYFVTLCVKYRYCLFGEIFDRQMILNDAGIMVYKWYNELENKFPDIKCHESMVMPNHFHCIIENTGGYVGAALRVCPDGGASTSVDASLNNGEGRHIGLPLRLPLRICADIDALPGDDGVTNNFKKGGHAGPPLPDAPILGEHPGSPLWQVIQWFKTMSTNEYIRNVKASNWPRFDGKLWQRNYWEHIIRDEKSYDRIAEYIINNPKNWKDDSIHPIHPKNNG